MCLGSVDKTIKVTKGVGWKCFLGTEDKLEGLCTHSEQPFKQGVWITDPSSGKLYGGYETGYHMYRTKGACERAGWRYNSIRRVDFRSVTATGTNSGFRAVVAREIYIHPKETKGERTCRN